MSRPLLHLVLILKDEEKVIEKTLDSCLGVVDGVTVVLDRDTTDNTMRAVVEWARHHGILLRMTHETFENFAAQRNKALDHSAASIDPPVFALSMSADEVLQGGDKLRAFLEARRDDADGAYVVTMQTDTRRWPYTRVLRTDARWRYEGIVHEQPVSPEGESAAAKLIPGVTVLHAETDPVRKLKRLREYDLPLLAKHVEDESKPLLDRARGMFFLAETHLFIAHNTKPDADGEKEPGGAWFSHYMQAMALYWRHAQLSERQAMALEDSGKGKGALAFDSAMRAYFMFYYVARKLELFGAGELEPRLKTLCAAAPNLVEARLLLADCAADVDPRRGLFLALQAHRVFEQNQTRTDQIRFATTEMHVGWSSLALAARCAHALGDMRQAKTLATRAIAAGCPQGLFAFEGEEKRA